MPPSRELVSEWDFYTSGTIDEKGDGYRSSRKPLSLPTYVLACTFGILDAQLGCTQLPPGRLESCHDMIAVALPTQHSSDCSRDRLLRTAVVPL